MRRISEEITRKPMIDPSTLPMVAGRSPQLERAGWYLRDHAKVKIEIPVDGYNADQIRFLLAVQSVFLQKRHLETADTSTSSVQRLYELPLDMFGAHAVERWFTEKEVKEVVEFANRMSV